MQKDALPRPAKHALLFGTAALIGMLAFVATYGAGVLDCTNVGWLMNGGDLAQHYFGWAFYRNSPWGFPIGMIEGLVEPDRISVIYMDCIPLLAVPFKLLSPLLPADFQYFGLWGIATYALTAVFGAMLVYRWSKNPFICLCAAALFTCSSGMLWRMYAHTALAGHWIPLAGLLLVVWRDRLEGRWQHWAAWAALMVVATATHLYLAAMVGVMLLADCLCGALRTRTWRNAGRNASLVVAAIGAGLLNLWLLGAFAPYPGGGSLAGAGLGQFSANLNTFFYPMGYSTLLKDLPFFTVRDGQYEGMGYLGLGVLVLAACALVLWAVRRGRVNWPLLLSFCLLFGYSLSPVVTWNSHVLFTIPWPGRLLRIFSMFHATGRFIWPAMYIVFLLGIVGVALWAPRRVACVLIGLCTALQIADLSGAMAAKHQGIEQSLAAVVEWDPGWEALKTGYDTVIVMAVPYPYNNPGINRVGRFALENGLKITEFYTARPNFDRLTEKCQAFRQELEEGRPRANAIYVFDPNDAEDDAALWGDILDIRTLDGVLVGTAKK